MRFLVLICVVLLLAQADSQGLLGRFANRIGKIINYSNENNGADGYKFSYESDDGTKREEKGEFVNGVWTVTGMVAHTAPDGSMHVTDYKADDKGYQAMERGALSAGALASLAG